MAKKPKNRKAGAAGIEGLLTALKFIEPAAKDVGPPNATHVKLSGSWAVVFDGITAMGHAIDSDIEACPHTATLITALSKCEAQTQITQLDDGRLSIKSGGFSAIVPCLDPALLAPVAPDPVCGVVDERVFAALKVCGKLATETAQRIVAASVLLRSGSAVGTDGAIMFEWWHGTDLPTLVIPKSFISVLADIKEKPIRFGFSQSSVTFYFENGSWIRSQLYAEKWPDVDKILNTPATAYDIPIGFWEAIDKISDLCDDTGSVYFHTPNSLATSPNPDLKGAMASLQGTIPAGIIFDVDYLIEVAPLATRVDFRCGERGDMSLWYGDNFRGVVMQRSKPVTAEPKPVESDFDRYADNPARAGDGFA